MYAVLWLAMTVAYVGLAAAERIPFEAAIACPFVAPLFFQPVRHQVERLADRWLFGGRLAGYELLARCSAMVESARDPRDMAPALAATIRQTLRTRWARVSVRREGDGAFAYEPIGAAGIGLHEAAKPVLVTPIVRADEPVGVLECGPRTDGGRFQARERELLATLGRQVALAMHNARLVVELEVVRRQARELAISRARIVQTEEAARRRLERDIHDGVQQELVALAAKLRLARNQLLRDPGLAADTLIEVQDDARQALEDLRELTRGIYPPVLSDRGLLEAIEARVARLPMRVTIEPDGVGRDTRYPEEIEGAAYFFVCEALANTLKHAAAECATIRLATTGGSLRVEVADDGRGFDPDTTIHGGLRGLADRVKALDGRLLIDSRPRGGSRLIAELPIPEHSDG